MILISNNGSGVLDLPSLPGIHAVVARPELLVLFSCFKKNESPMTQDEKKI